MGRRFGERPRASGEIVREHLSSVSDADESTQPDVDAVRRQTLAWISGWRTSPEKPFSLRDFEHIYVRDEGFSSLDFGRPHDGFDDWASAAAYYAKFMAIPVEWRLEASSEPRVVVRGSVAWAKVALRSMGRLADGTKIGSPESRATLIFEKRDGEWLVVHEHGSVALPFPSTEAMRKMMAE